MRRTSSKLECAAESPAAHAAELQQRRGVGAEQRRRHIQDEFIHQIRRVTNAAASRGPHSTSSSLTSSSARSLDDRVQIQAAGRARHALDRAQSCARTGRIASAAKTSAPPPWKTFASVAHESIGIEHHPQRLAHPRPVRQPHMSRGSSHAHRARAGEYRAAARAPDLHVGARRLAADPAPRPRDAGAVRASRLMAIFSRMKGRPRSKREKKPALSAAPRPRAHRLETSMPAARSRAMPRAGDPRVRIDARSTPRAPRRPRSARPRRAACARCGCKAPA